jgi:hypothetical protein
MSVDKLRIPKGLESRAEASQLRNRNRSELGDGVQLWIPNG